MTSKVSPIKPGQISGLQNDSIPAVVIETFNEFLVQHCRGKFAVIRQDEVVAALVAKGLEREEIFDKNWLDIEDLYREAGWKVSYDKPGYNEMYEPTWDFKMK